MHESTDLPYSNFLLQPYSSTTTYYREPRCSLHLVFASRSLSFALLIFHLIYTASVRPMAPDVSPSLSLSPLGLFVTANITCDSRS